MTDTEALDLQLFKRPANERELAIAHERDEIITRFSELQREAARLDALLVGCGLARLHHSVKAIKRASNPKPKDETTTETVTPTTVFQSAATLDDAAAFFLFERINELTEEIELLNRQRQSLRNVLQDRGCALVNHKPRLYCMLCGRRITHKKKCKAVDSKLVVAALVNGTETTVKACSPKCREEAQLSFNRRIEWQRRDSRSLEVAKAQMETIKDATKRRRKASPSQQAESQLAVSSQG